MALSSGASPPKHKPVKMVWRARSIIRPPQDKIAETISAADTHKKLRNAIRLTAYHADKPARKALGMSAEVVNLRG